jgi:hypothetical protein
VTEQMLKPFENASLGVAICNSKTSTKITPQLPIGKINMVKIFVRFLLNPMNQRKENGKDFELV